MDKKLDHNAATLDDMLALIANIRPADRDEAEASEGSLELALYNAFMRTPYPTALSYRGDLIAIYGAAPMTFLSTQGALWLMGTPLMRRYAGKVFHDAKLFVAHAREHYPVLVNYVDARNTESIRWLAALGFTIDPPQPFGVKQLPFHRFHMGLNDV